MTASGVAHRRWLSLRVWLPLAFTVVVAVTVGVVANLFLDRFQREFREQAHDAAIGQTVGAAVRIAAADDAGDDIDEAVQELSFAPLFVFDEDGRLLTAPRSQGVAVTDVRERDRALAAALTGRRYVQASPDGALLVGLPLAGERARAVVAYSRHPDLDSGLGIARSTIVEAAAAALVVGALAGCVVAWLVARRIRRITSCAVAIEHGDFETPLTSRFGDEIGRLAATIDAMRRRLRASFFELEGERDRLRRLVERLHEGVVSVAPDGTIVVANDAAKRLLGGLAAEGSQLPARWHGFPLAEFATRLFVERSSLVREEIETPDAQVIALVGVPAHGGDAALIVLSDLTEEARRERAEREFVTNAAHELRTPLQTIIGAVEALSSGAEEDPALRKRFIGHIDREAQRLARLTRSLLVLARVQTREEEPPSDRIALRPRLDAVAAAARSRNGVAIEVECPEGLEVIGDADLLEQVLANLTDNAVKHTEHGRVELRARRTVARTVQISVTDTGSGITRADRERVFERFYRGNGRDGDGFGLGLAIVRQAVDALGGTIAIGSTPGGGTRVDVDLRSGRGEA